ncbi:hypothetical protein MSG28_001307, partial [Choristoneura fumiferana]
AAAAGGAAAAGAAAAQGALARPRRAAQQRVRAAQGRQAVQPDGARAAGVVRRRGGAGGGAPALNNLDTLRSYGSAGDELEGLPPDIRRNLNLDPAADRKPWSEQMHLHSFVDNKIYNDLKSCKNRLRATSPVLARRAPGRWRARRGGDGAGALVGGYHWDCSDWCGGGGLPGISEVAGSERPDSSEQSPPSLPSLPSPPARRATLPAPPPFDTDSAPDDPDPDPDHFDSGDPRLCDDPDDLDLDAPHFTDGIIVMSLVTFFL